MVIVIAETRHKNRKYSAKIGRVGSSVIYSGLEIRPFLQSGIAKKCAGMAKFVISHFDELANLRPS